jgi:His/Glu/Gln/Arg/opine family amino acid ABC transporter permease subunit
MISLGFFYQLGAGAWITIQLSLSALLLGLCFGLLGALAESSKLTPLRHIAIAIISVLRGLPELVVIFFVYFGGTLFLTYLVGRYVNVSSFIAGVFALALLFGAYASQTFRGAFLAIPKGQIEAGKGLGFTAGQLFFRIQLPQIWRYALPGLGNLWLVLLKDTALISLIGLSDLMRAAQTAASTTQKPFTFYLGAAVFYLIMTSVSHLFLHRMHVFANKPFSTHV